MIERTDWRHRLFDDLLGSIHVGSSVYARPELRAPWGFAVANRGATFHIVARGACWLDVDGGVQFTKLSGGEFVLLPRGDPHVLRDAPTTTAVPLAGFLNTRTQSADGIFRAGGHGPLTKLICGTLQFEDSSTDPLLAVLPTVVHVKRSGTGAAPWLYPTLVQVQSELKSGSPGAESVISRLLEVVLVQAVRAYFAANADAAQSGWLAGLRDPQIGPALALLHGRPGLPWTVATLADRLGLSRSAFAAKFTETVGEPLAHYLTRLRVTAAAARLSASNATVRAIATSLGYQSVSAFSKAFARYFGTPPGQFRAARGQSNRNR